MEFANHVWTVKDIVIIIGVPCIFAILHYLSEWLCEVDKNRSKR